MEPVKRHSQTTEWKPIFYEQASIEASMVLVWLIYADIEAKKECCALFIDALSLSLSRSSFSKLFSGYDRQQIGCCHFHMLWIQCKHTHIKSVCIGNGICMTRVFCASNWNEEFDLMEMQKNVANLFAICFRTLTCCIRLKAEKKSIQLE